MRDLPIGIENYKEMIDKRAYYVDKTELILEVIKEKFVLFTRPRRFGKTLNMSMLYYFFSIKEKDNAYLFEGLNITKHPKVMEYQNQFPTLFITLKDMKSQNMEEQKKQFADIIKNIVLSNKELLNSEFVDESDKVILNDFRFLRAEQIQLKNALKTISRCLMNCYHKKVIILIDEYDVPLQSAYSNDYYDEMVDFLKNIFSSALKTNDFLEKGIMTGCLRISKESIFTGLNNFNVYSILDYRNSKFFGFTEIEVKRILNDYHMSECFNEVKEWYDGYLFGDKEIYNPWSTLKYVDRKLQSLSLGAVSFWANTSGNDIIYDYIKKGNKTLHDEFETLMQGKTIKKAFNLELTYRDMDDIDNIYSFLLLTGYLKVKEDKENHNYELIIPNKEVYEIYQQSFMNYFRVYTRDRKINLYQALVDGNVNQVNVLLNEILAKSISYYDNQENFYHGFLIGLFSDETVDSNKESGDGRFDICILPENILGTAVIIECKHSLSDDDLIEDSKRGVKQIIEKKYLEDKKFKKYRNTVGYGISFYKKQCYVVKV